MDADRPSRRPFRGRWRGNPSHYVQQPYFQDYNDTYYVSGPPSAPAAASSFDSWRWQQESVETLPVPRRPSEEPIYMHSRRLDDSSHPHSRSFYPIADTERRSMSPPTGPRFRGARGGRFPYRGRGFPRFRGNARPANMDFVDGYVASPLPPRYQEDFVPDHSRRQMHVPSPRYRDFESGNHYWQAEEEKFYPPRQFGSDNESDSRYQSGIPSHQGSLYVRPSPARLLQVRRKPVEEDEELFIEDVPLSGQSSSMAGSYADLSHATVSRPSSPPVQESSTLSTSAAMPVEHQQSKESILMQIEKLDADMARLEQQLERARRRLKGESVPDDNDDGSSGNNSNVNSNVNSALTSPNDSKKQDLPVIDHVAEIANNVLETTRCFLPRWWSRIDDPSMVIQRVQRENVVRNRQIRSHYEHQAQKLLGSALNVVHYTDVSNVPEWDSLMRRHNLQRPKMMRFLSNLRRSKYLYDRRLSSRYRQWFRGWQLLHKSDESASLSFASLPYRPTRRGIAGDAVRTDEEMNQVLQNLIEEEPNVRWVRTLAPRQPMLWWESPEKRFPFLNSNRRDDECAATAAQARSLHLWREVEKQRFVEAYLMYPKQFGSISAMIKTKTANECVLFYYRNKKSLQLKRLLRQQTARRKRVAGSALSLQRSQPQLLENAVTVSSVASNPVSNEQQGSLTTPTEEMTKNWQHLAALGVDLSQETDTPRWSVSDKAKAVQGFSTFGKDYEAVASFIGTKTASQCRHFYMHHRKRLGLDALLPKRVEERDEKDVQNDAFEREENDALEREEEENALDEEGSDTLEVDRKDAAHAEDKTFEFAVKIQSNELDGDETEDAVDEESSAADAAPTEHNEVTSYLGNGIELAAMDEDQTEDENPSNASNVSNVTAVANFAIAVAATRPAHRRNVSYWSKAERLHIVHYLQQYGKQWARISEAMQGSKSASQVRNYYENHKEELDSMLLQERVNVARSEVAPHYSSQLGGIRAIRPNLPGRRPSMPNYLSDLTLMGAESIRNPLRFALPASTSPSAAVTSPLVNAATASSTTSSAVPLSRTVTLPKLRVNLMGRPPNALRPLAPALPGQLQQMRSLSLTFQALVSPTLLATNPSSTPTVMGNVSPRRRSAPEPMSLPLSSNTHISQSTDIVMTEPDEPHNLTLNENQKLIDQATDVEMTVNENKNET